MFKVGDKVVSVARESFTMGKIGEVVKVEEKSFYPYTIDFYEGEDPLGWPMKEKELKHVS